jgi:hypothetical protein
MIHRVTEALKGANRFSTGADRLAAHGATSISSSLIGGGTASPCFFRLARYPSIASLMFASASARVFPWEMHPGNEGHSVTKTPSSSTSMVTR